MVSVARYPGGCLLTQVRPAKEGECRTDYLVVTENSHLGDAYSSRPFIWMIVHVSTIHLAMTGDELKILIQPH